MAYGNKINYSDNVLTEANFIYQCSCLMCSIKFVPLVRCENQFLCCFLFVLLLLSWYLDSAYVQENYF